MKRNLELMTALLVEAENSCGRITSVPGEVSSILLLRDIGCVEAVVKNNDAGVPETAQITRMTNLGHIELEKARNNGSRTIDGSNATKIRIVEDDREEDREKVRAGLVSTRDREIERYENIMYSVASGCIALALGVGSFCYSYGISLLSLKWLLLATFCSSGFAIIALLVSGKASILSREYGVNAMDTTDSSWKKEWGKKSEWWNEKTELLNKIAPWAFGIGVALTMVALIWLMIVMPSQKPVQDTRRISCTIHQMSQPCQFLKR